MQFSRRRMLLGMGLAATGFGCGGLNPFVIIPALIQGGGRTKAPAEFELTPPPKKTEAKVVVFVSSAAGLHPDLAGVDRMLNAELITMLDARLKANEEKVLVLKMPTIDKFRSDNPNWRSVHPYDIGKEFKADYVIDVEIQEMDLFKEGSQRRWLKGHATVSVNAYDLSKPLKEPAYRLDYTPEYPHGREEEVEGRDSGVQRSAFRMKFVQRIASDISVKFVASAQEYRVD
ncbi:MAG: hypothetical protein EXS09_12395 [Gemmataceae bacterium]|nr:hypothetical protein [Gemmataceae bacterium]